MSFFKLPRWIIWTLVSLGVLLLCAVWQWRRAMKLLDDTADKLEDARREKAQAEARAAEAAAAAERERALSGERARIAAEAEAELKRIEDEKKSALKTALVAAAERKKDVAESGTAVSHLKKWKQRKGR